MVAAGLVPRQGLQRTDQALAAEPAAELDVARELQKIHTVLRAAELLEGEEFRLQAGRLVGRLLEIETYRMMALLGLPYAMQAAPSLNAIENELATLAAAAPGATAAEGSTQISYPWW